MTTMTNNDLKQIDTLIKNNLKNTATKDDLKNFATKKDLTILRKEMATKEDLKQMATKEDLKALKKELKEDIDNAVVQVIDAVDKTVVPLVLRVEKIEGQHAF